MPTSGALFKADLQRDVARWRKEHDDLDPEERGGPIGMALRDFIGAGQRLLNQLR